MRSLFVLAALATATLAAPKICLASVCIPQGIDVDFTFVIDVSNAVYQTDFAKVKQWLLDFTSQLTLSNYDTQIAIYTYATVAKSYGTLSSNSNRSVLINSINSINHDNTGDRQLYLALTKEENEVTAASGYRNGYKHVMVLISADAWTGTNVLGSSILRQIQSKYDMILAIGLGSKSVQNQATALQQFTGVPEYVFYSFTSDQLQFVSQWLYMKSCPNVGMPTTAVPTQPPLPTQNINVPCQLSALNTDVYLVVDTSAAISATDFAQLKQMLINFINPFSIGNTQFALVATAIDSELYGTQFHTGQLRSDLINTIQTLSQDGSTGQTLKLSLQAIEYNYLSKNYSTSKKVIVYVTGTTSWDTDPIQYMKQLAQKYGVKPVAVQWTSGASAGSLSSLTGGSACVNAYSNRANAATWLQTKMCK
ncbi:hypothetical protein Q1695_014365 [Nippostrongylus brasiliensis]|nr:hypothetical protein Q1695_014365 [Nippostrongylus brasiliensis]